MYREREQARERVREREREREKERERKGFPMSRCVCACVYVCVYVRAGGQAEYVFQSRNEIFWDLGTQSNFSINLLPPPFFFSREMSPFGTSVRKAI